MKSNRLQLWKRGIPENALPSLDLPVENTKVFDLNGLKLDLLKTYGPTDIGLNREMI